MAGVRLATGYIEISAETSQVPKQIQDALSKAGTDAAPPVGKQIGKDLAINIHEGLRTAPTPTGGGSVITDIIQGKTTIGPNVRAQGKKVGQEVATGINQGIQQSTTTAKVDDWITKAAKPKETGEKIGKEVKEGIDKGMADAGEHPTQIIKDAVKDFGKELADSVKAGHVDDAFSRVGDVVSNAANAINNVGHVVGLNLDSVANFGKDTAGLLDRIGGDIQTVVNTVTTAKDQIHTLAGDLQNIRTGDAGDRLHAAASGIRDLGDAAESHGLHIKNFTDRLGDFVQTSGDIAALGIAGRSAAAAVATRLPFLAPAIAAAAPATVAAATVGTILATPGSEAPRTIGPDAAALAAKREATRKYADRFGGRVPPGTAQWLDGTGPLPPELAPFYQTTGPEGPPLAPPPGWQGPSPEVIEQRKRQQAGLEAPPPPSYAPGAAPAPAAAPGAISTPQASVSASVATVNIGSANISGASIPQAYTGSHQTTTGAKSWFQSGGDVPGSGAVPIMAHGGEHVVTADEVAAKGGHAAVEAWRKAPRYDDGGAVPKGTPSWLETAANRAGMTPDQYTAAMAVAKPGQDIAGTSQADLQKGMFGQAANAASGGKGDDPDQGLLDAIDMARTAGFIPTGAGSKAVAGTSFVAGLLNLGNEAVGGLIDTGAAAAQTALSMAASAGSFGAGGQAAGALGGIGIQLAASEGKRAVSYGFQMASILADSVIDQVFGPFGGPPRWIGYDYTQFVPHINIGAIGTTTVEKAMQAGQGKQAGPGQQPGGPVTPEHLGGEQPVGPPVPKFGQPAPPTPFGAGVGEGAPPGGGPGAFAGATQGAPPPAPKQTSPAPPTNAGPFQGILDGLGIPTADEGGWLMPNSPVVNKTNRPELILSPQQLDEMQTNGNKNPYSRGGDTYHITAVDAEDVGRQIDKRKRFAMMQYSGRP